MTYLDLFTSPIATFGGLQCDYADADFVVIGVPFDATSTYRSGSRFAPLAIREASLNIETFSLRAEIDLEDLRIHDAGDLHVTGDVDDTLRRLETVSKELLSDNKMPVFIGGEHTVTLGAVRGIHEVFALLSFDAHLDLRDAYLGQPVCHATVVRRINDTVKPLKVIEVGTRAVSREEIAYADSRDIVYITSHQIVQTRLEETVEKISSLLGGHERVYLTIDMDVLSPAFAPAVQNPEPEGLTTRLVLDLLSSACGRKLVAFDLVEVAPHYDMGTTAVQAAKIIFEVLCHIYKDKNMGTGAT